MKKVLIAACAGLLAVTAACSSSGSGGGGGGSSSSTKAYKILFIGPLSGAFSPITDAQLSGLKAGISVVNAQGGINGRKVTVTTDDDQGDPTKAVSVLQKALSSSTPDLVYPGITTEEGLAMMPLLTQKKILSMAGLVSDDLNDTKKYPYFFSIGQSYQPAADELAKQLAATGAKKIAYLRNDTAAGQSEIAALRKAASATGIQVTDISYDPTAVDLTDTMQRANDSHPDAVVFAAYGAPAGYILQARQKLQVTKPMYGDLLTCLTNVATLVPASELKGLTLQCPKVLVQQPGAQSAARTTFITALKKQGAITQLLSQYSGPYDAVQILKLAAKQAGATDTAKMTKALDSLTQPAVKPYVTYSSWSYTATDHQIQVPQSDYVLLPAGRVADGVYAGT